MEIKRKFLEIMGDVKFTPIPLIFFYYEHGDYYKVSGAGTERAKRDLRPGDIIMRGYRWYVSDWFINGWYDHAGVYVGNGKIIHAVSEGVVETNVTDFLRCDRFIILRPDRGDAKETDEYITNAIERVKRMIGKRYDIDFSDNNNQIYCFELAAIAYLELGVHMVDPGWFAKLFGIGPKYLDQSFLSNWNFRTVLTGGDYKPCHNKEK